MVTIMETDTASNESAIRLSDLADLSSIRQMLEAYCRSTGMPWGLVDAVDGSIILGDGWQDVCARFHRAHPVSTLHCDESRCGQSEAPNGHGQVYTCGNGLPAIRIPVVVGQQHLATLLFGPFYFEDEPFDNALFRDQARQYGYDEAAYFDALRQLPVFSKPHVRNVVAYGQAFGSFLAAAATQQSRLLSELAAREKAEAGLQEKASFIRHLIDAIPSPVFFKDRAGVYRQCNDAFAAMLKKDKADIIGKSTFELSSNELARKYQAMDEQLYSSSGVQRYEWQVADALGNVHEYLFTKSVFYNDGRAMGLIGIMTDITDRKKAEQALQDMCEKLERRVGERTRELQQANEKLIGLDKMKSDLLNTVSHEVRTPMTSILGFVKLVSKDFSRHIAPAVQDSAALKRKADRIADNLQIIELEGERLTRLLNDVLDAARIESGKMKWDDQAFPIKDFLQLAVATIKGQLKAQVGIEFSDDGASPWIKADPDRIMQVMLNLLNNAVKFTEAGQIRVSLKSRPDDLLEIAVSDTGIGLAASELERVFDRFHQVGQDHVGGDKPKGTGLGLSICKQVVEHYGGRIWAESAPGHGSRFTFVLPRYDAVG